MKKTDIWKVMILSFLIITGTAQLASAATGWQQDTQGNWTYLEHDKKVTNRWIQDDSGNWRFVGSIGLMAVNNWVNFENER